MAIRMYDGKDKLFLKACELAWVEPTRRQYIRYSRQNRGRALLYKNEAKATGIKEEHKPPVDRQAPQPKREEERPRVALRTNATMVEVIHQLSEGNPGAVRAVTELFKREDGLLLLLDLDDMNMRGPQIWVAYQYCGENADLFAMRVRDRNPNMVAAVNKESGSRYKAVTHGGSQR